MDRKGKAHLKFNLAMVVKDFSRYINNERNTSGNVSLNGLG